MQSPRRRSPSPPSMLHVSNLTRNVKADHLKVTAIFTTVLPLHLHVMWLASYAHLFLEQVWLEILVYFGRSLERSSAHVHVVRSYKTRPTRLSPWLWPCPRLLMLS